MIRLVCLLRRNPALSVEEFQAHWRDHHGPLIAGTPEVARHVVRYEQHPRVHAPGQWTGTRGIDGVAIQWFASMEDFGAFLAEPLYAERIAPDERHLLDLDATVCILTEEPNVVIGGP
jgi:hypothetical protein